MIYRFAGFELHPARGELRRDGEPLRLQPKPLALLALLIEERHRIVGSDELLERLWPGESVTQSSLSRAVSVARGALGDAGRSGWIRSHTRRGYRFHGEVVVLEEADAREASAGPGPAPGALPFVGRDDALARLRAAWSRALRGRHGVVVLSGPAGVGKTRLGEEFAAEARARGGLVLHGRALEALGEPAFWVWAQILRRLLREDPESLRVPGLADSGELAALMPELSPGPADGPASHLPPEQRRFVFFDAVARALRTAAAKRPLLIGFEDLHWSDTPSLRMLEHLAFELEGAPVLILASVRSSPPVPDDPSVHTLSVLRRSEHCELLPLVRLGEPEVAALVEQLTGRAAPKLAARLFARTEGLPLFLREACRRLDALDAPGQPLDALPLPGADWVRDALAAVGEACARVLDAAAVVGREFSLPGVAAAAEVSRESALDALDEAVRAGVVEASPDAPARYRFVHDLFRESAYAALAPGARVRLHQRVASQLERQHGAHDERVVAELAHHHHRALAVGDPARAYACATRAAEQAFERFAYEQAAQHRLQALDALDHAERADDLRRLDTLIALGEAYRLSGERRQRRRTLGAALELARALGEPERFATAAIGLCELAEWGVRDDLTRAAVIEALERLEGPAPELQASLLTRLGYLEAMSDADAAERLLRRAVALTREQGAADPLEEALYALHFVLGGPDRHAEREQILEELRGAASAARDPVASVIAVLDVACDRLERGDPAGARALRGDADATAGNPPHPRTIWHRRVYDTGLALLEGRLGEVEQRSQVALELGRSLQHPYAEGCYLAHRSQLLLLRGEYAALLAAMQPALGARQGPAHWVKARVARAHLGLGQRAEARALYDEVMADGPAAIPRNLRWSATLIELAHGCAELGDAEGAAALCDVLAPAESHHAVMPMVVCYGGPALWALARLHELRGRADDADDLYREALDALATLGSPPIEAQLRLGYGRFLQRRRKPRDARSQLEAAVALAEPLGLAGLAESARRARAG